jgi:hypothetical protein
VKQSSQNSEIVRAVRAQMKRHGPEGQPLPDKRLIFLDPED